MQLSTTLALIAALLLSANSVQADQCSSVRQRREFRQLTHAERLTYLNGIKSLMAGPRPSKYERYVVDHVDVSMTAHGTAQFLSWHRAYLRDVEKNLQAINPSIMLPYWDWAYDSQ
ncbi:hypothetical protein THASP1DRAFT_14559, partial [Thamnocephalis sphaerospora]